MQKFKSLLPLILISIIGFSVLSYKLSDIPNGVYLDEATTGYNAYSILKTGKDEYGKEFPWAFRFFGSYTPPLYTYLTVIPVSIFGLDEFSVRIVSVVAGILMIFVIWGFLKQALINKKIILPLIVLFIITPWNFFYARTGYELYLGFSLFSLGSLFCWKGLKQKFFLIPGLIILSLATYASHPQIYSVPLFILGFTAIFYKDISKKYLVIGLLISLIIQIPHILLLTTNAFLNKSDLFYSAEVITNAQKILFLPGPFAVALSFIFSFLSKLTTYFSPYSLFFFADPDPQRSMPGLSIFYNWMIIPYLTGAYVLYNNLKDNRTKFLILLIIVAVIPPALTKDPFSTQRGLNLLLPLFLIVCIGISSISEKLNLKKIAILFTIILPVSLVMLWRSYIVLLPAERAVTWNYGYKQIAKFISDNPDKYFVVEQIHAKPSYIELAFFLKLDPHILQNSVDPSIKLNYYNLSNFNPDYKFKNIEVRTIKWEEDIYKPQILIGDELVVSKTQAEEHFLTEIFSLNDPHHHPVIKAFSTNPEQKCRATNNASLFCKPTLSNTIN